MNNKTLSKYTSPYQRLSILGTFLMILLIIVFFPPPTKAASFDLEVSPPIFQIELTPPAVAEVKEQISLENKSSEPMDLTLSYLPFQLKGENGEIEYLKDGKTGGIDPLIFQRISILQGGKRVESLTLPPQTKRSFDLVVTIPKDSPPSDYYFTILFSNSEESATSSATQEERGSVSQSLGGVGINVLLSVGPKGKTNGAIEEFSTDMFHTEGPVPFMVKIKNNSPHFIYPEANIVIKNMFGQTIGKVDLLPVNILGNSTRSMPSREQFVYAAEGDETTEKDSKKIQEIMQKAVKDHQPLAVWPEKFLFGPYTATLTVAFSKQGPLYVDSVTFIGFPLHIIIGFFIAIGMIFIIRSRLKQRHKVG